MLYVAIALLAVVWGTSNWRQVPADAQAVVVRFGRITSVQQAVATGLTNTAGIAFLAEFVAEAKRSGLIASLIERHHVRGLTVAALDHPST